MNETIKQQLEHRTIRKFKNRPLSEETINTLKEVAIHTATSQGMQMASIIRVTDPEKARAIADVCRQDYVAEAPELWIFLVDIYRNVQIAEAGGVDDRYAGDLERFLQGYSDAVLMAQNVNNAVESLGLGAVFLGSIQNNMAEMIDILNLPKYTAPVIGLAFGEPDQKPQLKPRMSHEMRIYDNSYHQPDNYQEVMADYDQEMTTYYDLREENRRSDSFNHQVCQQLSKHDPVRVGLVETLADQGFDVYRKRWINESDGMDKKGQS